MKQEYINRYKKWLIEIGKRNLKAKKILKIKDLDQFKESVTDDWLHKMRSMDVSQTDGWSAEIYMENSFDLLLEEIWENENKI